MRFKSPCSRIRSSPGATSISSSSFCCESAGAAGMTAPIPASIPVERKSLRLCQPPITPLLASDGAKSRSISCPGISYDPRSGGAFMHHRIRSLAAALLAAGVLAASPVSRSASDPPEFTNLRWRLVGPFRGGRTLSATGIVGDPRTFYTGAVGGGVWKTDNGGRTWDAVMDGQPIASIGAVAVAPSDPRVVYVGSGEADMRSDISYGNGMYRSSDSGKTWKRIGLADTRQIGRILVDPNYSNRVFVAALGHGFGPNAERGVFRSTDGGATWTKVLSRDADTGAIDLAFAPGNPRTILAALWQTRRPPWNTYPPSNG